MIPRTCSIHTQTLLRVSAISLRNTKTINRESTTSCTWELSFVVEVHAASQHHMAFLFESHRLHYLIDVICPKMLGRHAMTAAERHCYSHHNQTNLMKRNFHC